MFLNDWLNRVGLVFDFMAFWFAAPEILGVDRLRAIENKLEQGLQRLPIVVYLFSFVAYIVISNLTKSQLSLMPNTTSIILQILSLWFVVASIVYGLLYFPAEFTRDKPLPDNMLEMIQQSNWPPLFQIIGSIIITGFLPSFLVTIILGPSKLSEFGLLFNAAFVAVVATHLTIPFIRLVLAVLANDESIRQRWFLTGALLFVLGFVFQFVATF